MNPDTTTSPPATEQPAAPPAPQPTMAPDSFAAKLLKAREAAGLSQAKAGKLAGVSGVTVLTWEKGRTKPSPQKQGAVLRRLREVAAPANTITVDQEPAGEIAPGATASVELEAHDPYDPTAPMVIHPDWETAQVPPIVRPSDFDTTTPSGPTAEEILAAMTKVAATPMPDIPVGNVHTTQGGVLLRRLADDDSRDGAEVIDGRRWFTVGFVAPHPRAKQKFNTAPLPEGLTGSTATLANKIATGIMEAPMSPVPGPVEPAGEPPHTEATPESPEPTLATAGPKRGWAFWNQ